MHASIQRPVGAGKLQALVYDILPPATAIIDDAIGLKTETVC